MRVRILIGAVLAAVLLTAVWATVGFGADEVSPTYYTLTNKISNVSGLSFTSDTKFWGVSIGFTNCVCIDTDNVSTQGLEDVTVEIRVGSSSDNTAYTGTVYASGGVTQYWHHSNILVPSNISTVSYQVKLTDSGSHVRIYPWRSHKAQEPMD